MAWYYAEDGQQMGPVSDPEFESKVRGGDVRGDTLVWREGMADWQPYEEVAAASLALAPDGGTPGSGTEPYIATSTAVRYDSGVGMANCVECGRLHPISEMLPYRGIHVCASCKPIFFQRVQEGADLPHGFEYAGFWARFLSYVIDIIIVSVLAQVLLTAIFIPLSPMTQDTENLGVVGAIALVLGLSFYVAVPFVYETFFLGRFGATPGKMALGQKVIRPDGSPITYLRGLGRFCAEILSGLILSIGYIMAAFDDEKRTLHDRIADTRVIKERF